MKWYVESILGAKSPNFKVKNLSGLSAKKGKHAGFKKLALNFFFVVQFAAHSVVQQQRQKISSAHQKICDNIINIRSSEYEQTTTMHSTGKQQLGYWMSNRVFVQFLRVVILKAVWL